MLHFGHYATLRKLPPEIASLRDVRRISLRNSPVKNVAPISGMRELGSLDLRGTDVDDLSPLAELTSLSDGAMSSRPTLEFHGLDYRSTPVANKAPYDYLVTLDQPARTIETLNYIRRARGLHSYYPTGYKPPEDFIPQRIWLPHRTRCRSTGRTHNLLRLQSSLRDPRLSSPFGKMMGASVCLNSRSWPTLTAKASTPHW